MENYIYETLKEVINILKGEWEVLVPVCIGSLIGLLILDSDIIRRFYIRYGLSMTSSLAGGIISGILMGNIGFINTFILAFIANTVSLLILLIIKINSYKLLTAFAIIYTFISGFGMVMGSLISEASGKDLYIYLAMSIIPVVIGLINAYEDEKEEERERMRREKYTKVLTGFYESPLILPPSVGAVRKYSEEERQKELYELIMQDILNKEVDEETFNAIDKIKDPKLRERLLKEAYETKIEIEKEKAYREGEMEGESSGYLSGYSDGFADGYAAGSDP